jgi:hypothetical protein
MIKERFVSSAVKFVLLGLTVLGIMTIDAQPSFACQGKCQANRMCGDLMNRKGLKDGDQRRAEYQKCQRDPQNYK